MIPTGSAPSSSSEPASALSTSAGPAKLVTSADTRGTNRNTASALAARVGEPDDGEHLQTPQLDCASSHASDTNSIRASSSSNSASAICRTEWPRGLRTRPDSMPRIVRTASAARYASSSCVICKRSRRARNAPPKHCPAIGQPSSQPRHAPLADPPSPNVALVPASHNDACRNGGNPSPDLNEPACNTAVELATSATHKPSARTSPDPVSGSRRNRCGAAPPLPDSLRPTPAAANPGASHRGDPDPRPASPPGSLDSQSCDIDATTIPRSIHREYAQCQTPVVRKPCSR
jgi:hypothetical protein